MTREELHALVWSQPMRSAAKARGISDVALAKQCRRAGVPVPARGYWNKKQAGKPVVVQPLPPLPIGAAAGRHLSGFFPALKPLAHGDEATAAASAQDEEGPIPPPPVFIDIALVRQQIDAAVGEIKVPSRLTQPHPIVARLLRQDEDRRAKADPKGFSYDYYGPKFDKPLQQRRLRILSTLFLALERLGCKISGSTHAGEKFSISVGGLWLYILFAVEGQKFGDPFFRGRGHGRQEGERLRFDITGHSPDRDPPIRTWRDDKVSIESQIAEIVCSILVKAEEDARDSAVRQHRYQIEARSTRIREARLAVERAEKERTARREANAKARIQSLIDGADALEKAERIRRYVAAVQLRLAARSDHEEAAALADWSAWALAQADSIDPTVGSSGAGTLKRWRDLDPDG